MNFFLKLADHFVTYGILFLLLFFVAVSLGFDMAQYSIEEAQVVLTVTIVREDSLTAIQDYSVELLRRSDSTATHGISMYMSVHVGGRVEGRVQ